VREIASSFLFALGIFSLLSLVFFSSKSGMDVRGTMGVTGVFITRILGRTFGLAAFIVPLVSFYAAALLFRNALTTAVLVRLAAIPVLLVSTTTLLGLLYYNSSLLGYEPPGGWVGTVLATLLREKVSGTVGSYVLALLSMTASLIVVMNLSVVALFSRLRRLAAAALNLCASAASAALVRVVEWAEAMSSRAALGRRLQVAAARLRSPLGRLMRRSRPMVSIQLLPEHAGDAPSGHIERAFSPAQGREEGDDGPDPASLPFDDDTPPIVVEERRGPAPVDGFAVTSPACSDFALPPVDLLDPKVGVDGDVDREAVLRKAELIERKLADLGVKGKVTQIRPGPVITMFEYKPAPGIKINKISGLASDLAMGLSAISVRIVAPIPGKDVVGIEVPNDTREPVLIRELIEDPGFVSSRSKLTLALGKDLSGKPFYMDLRKAPHLMIAGTTGSGKSVLLNALIASMLYKATPRELKLIMIDPKMLEFSVYEGIPHLLHPVVTEPREAAAALRWAVREMEDRYRLLSASGVRDIDTYNSKLLSLPEVEREDKWMPYVVIILDELADLMMVSAREVGDTITRLAQKARAAGIHLIVATQRPSVDVVAGLIKANFPARISFLVSSKVDSRIIMDAVGAEQLLGKGDMLFLQPGTFNLVRLQGALISDGERERLADYLRRQAAPRYDETITVAEPGDETVSAGDERDELYVRALEVIAQTGQVSISMLQRKLKIGYNRAARIVELMESDGIVGAQEAAGKPRGLLVDVEEILEKYRC